MQVCHDYTLLYDEAMVNIYRYITLIKFRLDQKSVWPLKHLIFIVQYVVLFTTVNKFNLQQNNNKKSR